MLMRIKFAVLSLIVAFQAFAGEATLTWTAPTKRVDDTALTNLGGYKIYYGTNPSALASQIQITNPGLLTYTLTNLAAGTWYFAMTAYDVTNLESARTNSVSKIVAQSPPNPPANVKMVDTIVYTLVKQRDAMVMLPVGNAPANTACISTQTANGYYVVPRADVTFTGSIRPEVVFATCL